MDVKKAEVSFYENLGDLEKSSEFSRKLISDYDSLMVFNQFEILAEFLKKQRIANDLKLVNFELAAEKRNTIYLVLILFLTAVLVLVLILRHRSHRRMNKELNEGKDKLFSIFSHDLWNSFIAMMQLVELLKFEKIVPKEKSKFIDHLEESANKTYSLLENLLNLSAFKTGKIDFKPKLFF